MTRFFGIAAVVALLVLATVSPASAAHHRSADGVPIKGTVTGENWVDRPPGPDGWQFFSSGTGQMSHLGRVDYFLTQSSSFGPGGVVVSTGTITFTAPNGDTLVIAQAVTSEIVETSQASRCQGRGTSTAGPGASPAQRDRARWMASETSPVVTPCSASPTVPHSSISWAGSRTTRRIGPSSHRRDRDGRGGSQR